MQIRVLGPVEASVDDRPLALGGAKQRAVLAMLGLEANRAVTADRLIEGLWGEEPPPSAAKMVQNYVWRLRKLLENDGGTDILTRGRAYELRIDREQVDACRLERLVSEAARAADNGGPGNAARAALALFRGEPLADVAEEPFASLEIHRLEELRLTAAELAIDADLAGGRHQEIVGEIDALVADNPLRERFHAQRMLALYRCGRQAEALEAYRLARQTLVDQIGVEPSPDLRGLHDAILRQDPTLDVQPASGELQRELDPSAAPPLIGRDDELGRLRTRWQRAAGGVGSLVALVGAYGMGKTRVAAAIAGEAHRDGAAVFYAAGTGPPEAALAAIARARETRRPALLVVDDADRAPADVRVALRDLALGERPALVLATGQEAAALARLEPYESIVLEPLIAEGVRAIAGFYAPPGAAAVPVDTLLATSRGVPRRVHEAASEWARREATRRVDAAADRAAAGRTEARAMVDELAGSVVDLQSTRERAAGYDHVDDRVVCPYKGLAPFDADDTDYFFGRERLVAELVARLVGAPLLAVVGPSGSGKSSVVRAGLLPALAGGVLPGSHNWTQALIRPGEHPSAELRSATGRLARERRGVLAVDQFEELFIACDDEAERAEFVGGLVRTVRNGTIVVLAVRADFYGRCAAYPELSDLLGANNVLVGPMSRDELRRAIERPAERVRLSVEPELVDALLGDVEGRPGALPLLSTALLELWRGRDGRQLRFAAYARSGGVHGAVARLAEDAYVQLDPAQQEVAHRLLLRLADDEGGALVRRRIALADVAAGGAEVVRRLADRRLLTVDEGTVEIAHEALLREWPRLRGWLEADAEGRRLHHRLSDAARAWDAGGRDPGDLYRGGRLAVALDWRGGHEHELSSTERAFLDLSRAAADRAQRRLRLALAGVAAVLAFAIAGGVVAVHQRGVARTEARAAEAQKIGLQALTEPDLDRSLLLARQGVALDDSLATRSNLLSALLRAPAAIVQIRGPGNPLTAIDVAADGRTLAVGDSQGTVLFLDAETRRPVGRPFKAGIAIAAIRFSPDGRRVAVAGYDVNRNGFIELLDARTRRSLGQLATGFDTTTMVEAVFAVGALDFSPDSRVLAVDLVAAWRVTPPRHYTVRWDAMTGRRLGSPRRIASGSAPALAGFITGGTQLVTSSAASGATVIRDAGTMRVVRRFRAGGSPATVSPDGRMAALALPNGTLRLLDLRSGRLRELAGRPDAAVTAMRFTPDSRTLVTAGGDAPLIVWDVGDGARVETFQGHTGAVEQLAISADGGTVYSAGDDGSVIEWDLAGTRRLGRRFRVEPPSASGVLAATAAGSTFAVRERDHSVELLDSRTLARTRRIGLAPVAPVSDRPMLVAITHDGQTMAATTGGADVEFVDLRTGRPLGPPRRASARAVRALAFSPDGRWLATSGDDAAIYVWDVRRQRIASLYNAPGAPAAGLSVSPDGSRLAATVVRRDGSGELDVFSMPRAKLLARKSAPPGGQTQFSRDGSLLFYGDEAGRVWKFDTRTWKPRGRPLAGQARPGTFAVSPDDRVLATTSSDGTAQLWDVPSGRPIGTALPGVAGQPVSAAFVDRGQALVTLHDNGRGFVWNVQPRAWTRRACAIAGRPLTRAEWHDALPERDYAPAC